MPTALKQVLIWRASLARIEKVVSGHLGAGRVAGNAPGPCFSRHISMYLAKHVGRWSLPQIGRFYNGRHHTTVLHAIRKIEGLRRADESIDALLEVLTNELAAAAHESVDRFPPSARSALVEAVANRVIDHLAEINGDNVPKIAERALVISRRT